MRNIGQKEDLNQYTLKRNRSFRKALLSKLIDGIKNNDSQVIENKQVNPSRPQYISPADRSTYNYGYMEADEFDAGTPNVF